MFPYYGTPHFQWLSIPTLLTYFLVSLLILCLLCLIGKYSKKFIDNLQTIYFSLISVLLLIILIFKSPDNGALLRRIYYSTTQPTDPFKLGLMAIFVWISTSSMYFLIYRNRLREVAIFSSFLLFLFILPVLIQSAPFNHASPPEQKFYTSWRLNNYLWLLIMAFIMSLIFSVLSEFIPENDENKILFLSLLLAILFKLTMSLVLPDLFYALFEFAGVNLFSIYVQQITELTIPWYTPSDYIYDILAHPVIAEWPVIITPDVLAVILLSAGSAYLLTRNTSKAVESALINYAAIYVVGTIVFFTLGYFLGFWT